MKKDNKHQLEKAKATARNQNRKNSVISYRLQCEKTGNGLSHYVMYGDQKNSLV